MFFCVHCGKAFAQKMRFCPYCGKEQPKLEESEVPYALSQSPVQAPVYTAPTAPHTAFSCTAQPSMSNAAKVFGKLAFALGIAALCAGSLLVLLFAIFLLTNVSFPFSVEVVSVPLGVVSIVFSVLARKRGNHLTKPKLGLIFGIVALVLSLIGFILFLIYTQQAVHGFIDEMPDFSA